MLVTGGAGFLGQALVRELAATHLALDHHLELIAYDLADAVGMPTIRGDVLDPVALRNALVGIDGVIHGAVAVDWSDLNRAHLESVNVVGTQTVLDACIAAGVRIFLHTSTMDVLCGDGDVRLATEQTPYPQRFLDAYGQTKAESERRVRRAATHLSTAILRFSAMYGEGDPYKVPSMVAEARAGRLLFRIGDGTAHMQPVYVGNAANATLRAIDRLFAGDVTTIGRTFFVADHAPGNFFDWMAPIMAEIGYPLPKRRLPAGLARLTGTGAEWFARRMGGRPAITRSSVQALCETITVDDRETRKALGYHPPYSYEEAVARTVLWFKQQAHKSDRA
ncbi:MAG: 3-beta hydroxysteroid dehydrogenase/isomerase [Myxococcaceae bacterium]|nr:3-beta hydroxysteroid dehydrogenase/isomerase [Myxococcaceae bacterium]